MMDIALLMHCIQTHHLFKYSSCKICSPVCSIASYRYMVIQVMVHRTFNYSRLIPLPAKYFDGFSFLLHQMTILTHIDPSLPSPCITSVRSAKSAEWQLCLLSISPISSGVPWLSQETADDDGDGGVLMHCKCNPKWSFSPPPSSSTPKTKLHLVQHNHPPS